jgi:hypothetical protein
VASMRAAVRHILLLGAIVVGSAAAGAPALADQPATKELARAREDFRKGLSLEVAGDHAGALALFKQVALIKSTPQVRFHIAVCEEKTGDLVQALGSYKLALIDAEETAGRDAKDVATESRTAIAALEPRIPSLTLTRGDGAAGAKVELDGRALADVAGNAFPINPGRHSIVASAPGRESLRLEIVLADGEKKTIELILPAEKAKDVPPPVLPTVVPTTTAPIKDVDTPPPSGSPLRTAGIVVGSAGVVGLALGGVFLGLRQSAIDKLDAACGPDKQQCPPDLQGTSDDGKLYSTLFLPLMIGGGVAAAAGLTLILVAPSGKPKTPPTTAAFSTGAPGTPAGGTLFLRF